MKSYLLKKTRFPIAFSLLPILCIFLCISCGNRQSSDELPVDSATQIKIAGLKNATLLKQLDDCAFYLAIDEANDYCREGNLIFRYTPEKHKFDTLISGRIFYEEDNDYMDIWFRVIDYKVVEDGMLFIAEYERFRRLMMLCFPTGEIKDVIDDLGYGNVIFADTYVSFYRHFPVIEDYESDKFVYDSMYFRLDYSDLSEKNFSKTMASKNEEFERYVKTIQEKYKSDNQLTGGGLSVSSFENRINGTTWVSRDGYLKFEIYNGYTRAYFNMGGCWQEIKSASSQYSISEDENAMYMRFGNGDNRTTIVFYKNTNNVIYREGDDGAILGYLKQQ